MNLMTTAFTFLTTTGFFGILIVANRLRARARRIDDLSPNRLMTRQKIVFIKGPESLFYFGEYWNHIPHFLYEHGYQVTTVRSNELNEFQVTDQHIICAPSENEKVAKYYPRSITNLNFQSSPNWFQRVLFHLHKRSVKQRELAPYHLGLIAKNEHDEFYNYLLTEIEKLAESDYIHGVRHHEYTSERFTDYL